MKKWNKASEFDCLEEAEIEGKLKVSQYSV